MGISNIPSREAYELLSEYVDIMARHGADSIEARTFFEKNRQIPGFEQHAREQYSLEKEDDAGRAAFKREN